MKSFYALLVAVLVGGCVSGPKRAQFEQALVQNTTPGQGRAALTPLCEKGLSGACALLGKPAEPRRLLPVVQSVTSDTQARFVILVPKSESPLYFVRRGESFTQLKPERSERSYSKQATDQVEAFDLALKQNYELLILSPAGELWDKREFRALDVKRKRGRIAVISCSDEHMREMADKMWPQVLQQKPDVLLMIGDNVYADHLEEKRWGDTTAEVVWERYVRNRSSLPLYMAPQLIPVLATWDDHDFGRNDADRTYAYKEQSLETFLSFFAQRKPGPGFERGPGVASWWSAFGIQIGLLDGRFFRSPNKLDLPDQTHFGPEQEKWINDHLKTVQTPVWLVSGDQFFGGYHGFESYEGSHPKSFQAQLGEWRKSKAPIVFVSGDRHLSEIIKVPESVLGYPTYEITSSAIHAKVFADAFERFPNKNQLIGVAGVYNYSIVELMRAERGLQQLSVQAFGPDQKLLYQKTLTVRHP